MLKKTFLTVLFLLTATAYAVDISEKDIINELGNGNNTKKIEIYDTSRNILILKQNGKFGIIKFNSDSDINKINTVNCDFDRIEKITYLPTQKTGERFYYKLMKNNKTGAFDSDGNMTPVLYDDIKVDWDKSDDLYPEELFIVTQANKKGALRKQDNTYFLVIPIMFDDINYKINDGRFRHSEITQNGKKGVYIIGESGSGDMTLPAYFDEIDINPPYISVKQFGKYGAYHYTRQVVPIIYDKVKPDGRSVIVTLNNQQGAYSDDGVLVVPVGYDEVTYAENSTYLLSGEEPNFIVRKGNKYGVHGKIPVEFDSIEEIYRGYIVKKNNQYGLYHLTKGRLLKPEYDNISMQSSVMVSAEKNGKIVKTYDMNSSSAKEMIGNAFLYTCFFWLLIPLKGLP